MASLLLLRHGQIRANVVKCWHGSTDSPLTWRGKQQAKRTARFLARNKAVCAIYSSPLQRCQATAAAPGAALKIPVVVDPQLREYGIGEWEGKPFRELHREHDFPNLARSDLDFAPPGGETLRQVSARMVSAIHELHTRHNGMDKDAMILVVSHGASVAAALATLLEADPAAWVNYPLANCSLTELTLSPAPTLNIFNHTSHL